MLCRLRRDLVAQTGAVVRALPHWSAFSIRGIWGLIASSWATQFVRVLEHLGNQDLVLPLANRFFAGDDVVADMKPVLFSVTLRERDPDLSTSSELLVGIGPAPYGEVLRLLPTR